MTVEEAREFFHAHPRILKILDILDKVWLGYIRLGQSSTTLSWGEAQRIKLATELSKRSSSKTIYILDEPTTGLHFQDIEKLLHILHSLVDKGNTVIVIEHNMNIILNADYIIDIGPEWWDKWGTLVVAGDIDTVKKCKQSYTGQAIIKYEKNFKK
jgi:excinuclease ABC subunit A